MDSSHGQTWSQTMQRMLAVGLLVYSTVAASQAMAQGSKEAVGDRLWIWAHPAGVYNQSFLAPLGRTSRIEPADAAERMGLNNVIFVRYDGLPKPPFDNYYRPFRRFQRVYWSMVGAGGLTSETEREHAYRLAEQEPNLVGFILDDFFHGHATDVPGDADALGTAPPFPASLTPEQLRKLGQRTVRGQKIPIMAVVYTGQISPRAKAHLDEVDQVCLWTWRPAELERLETNFARLEALVPKKPIWLGCYMYDFADSRPLPVERMKRQTELGYSWLRQRRIQGMIFLATANVDVGLEAVEWTRAWIGRVARAPLD